MAHPFHAGVASRAEPEAAGATRRSFFRYVAAAAGGAMALFTTRAQAQAPIRVESSPRRITTYAIGEEGSGRVPQPPKYNYTTQALGEEGGRYTTYATGEEGSGGGVTTYALGEEGSGRVTTYALGEEGGYYYRPAPPRPRWDGGGTVTTFALGEEG